MQIGYTKSGETLEELAARTYAFEGKESATALRAAGQALRDANPFLRKLSEVPEGTAVLVPPLEKTTPAADTEQPAETAVALVVARLREAADQAIELLGGELKTEVADTRSTLETLAATDTRKLVRGDDALLAIHDATHDAAKERLDAADTLGDYRKQVSKQIDQDLKELLAALRLSGA